VTTSLDRIEHAHDLPGEWDELASNYFQTRAFLIHCQKHNPCAQRYYLLSAPGRLLAGGIVYTLRLDLLTYMGIRSPMEMHIAGIPCSVSSGGLLGDAALQGKLLRGIFRREKGLVACLNLDTLPPDVPAAVGRTWPDVVFTNSFSTWERYLTSLRYPYRRRMLQVQEDATGFVLQSGPCSSFTPDMHAMYLEVFNRSAGNSMPGSSGICRIPSASPPMRPGGSSAAGRSRTVTANGSRSFWGDRSTGTTRKSYTSFS
jgi:hypothetical protein